MSSDVSDADRLGNFLQGHDLWITWLAERCHVQGAGAVRSSHDSPAPSAAGTTPAGRRKGPLSGELVLHSCVDGMNLGVQGITEVLFCC